MSGDARACSSCGAAVRFVRSRATGGWLVLNLEPDARGNVTIDAEGFAVVGGDRMTLDLFARPGDAELAPPAGPTYRVHHATCPNAVAHRRRS